MESPHAPGAGVTRAWISLGSDRSKSSVAPAGSYFNADGRGVSDRSRLLYGVWQTESGDEILFDRQYRPRWRRTSNGTVVPADPSEWIVSISGERWFYTDRADIPTRRRITAAIAAEWGNRMSGISPSVREKLAKVLPLLGSDKGGERDAAALAADRILTKAGLTWPEIFAGKSPEHREPLLGTAWRKTCAELQKRPGALRPWERGFVTDLPRFLRLSMK